MTWLRETAAEAYPETETGKESPSDSDLRTEPVANETETRKQVTEPVVNKKSKRHNKKEKDSGKSKEKEFSAGDNEKESTTRAKESTAEKEVSKPKKTIGDAEQIATGKDANKKRKAPGGTKGATVVESPAKKVRKNRSGAEAESHPTEGDGKRSETGNGKRGKSAKDDSATVKQRKKRAP
eukprot:Gregarina_sp_Poly_1__3129@NODE_1883_length_3139_cov_2060_531576_g1222_i0_p2_GENE_NODE_1883_length_3139_cov_2060_531576_g1222_i0NODE_1883_length_3139_cov_2060_531576_g1222_i0_p2_ORF_typecomplete_len181_score59_33_NODE_1883_length_3139_cov_2060_531576_g1222_i0296838